MTALRQKLKSKQGASLLLALVFLFFAMSVGAIVLTAATANAGRLARLQQQEQRYLAVESAARLLKSDLSAISFKGSYSVTESFDAAGTSAGTTTGAATGVLSAPDYAKDLLQADFTALYQFKNGAGSFAAAARPLTLAVENPAISDFSYPEVTANCTVTDDYSLKIVITDAVLLESAMTLLFPPIVSQGEETAYIDGANGAYSTVTTYSTTVTFSTPTIAKGAA